jgi:hypothetical protein
MIIMINEQSYYTEENAQQQTADKSDFVSSLLRVQPVLCKRRFKAAG